MFKWETEEDRRTLVAPPAPGRPYRPSRWAWLLLLGGLALLGAAALLVLRGRLAERQQAMRRDVVAFVEREERARLFGAREVAPELVAPGVPRSWYSAYLETFVASEDARPVDLAVEETVLEEKGALVTLRLGEQRQMRYYRFVGPDWRRAPIPPAVWGDHQETVALPNGAKVIYRPRDAAFAQAVARDLPALFARLAQWPGELKVEQIEVAPAEFSEPIVRDADTSIVLNSPLLVPLRGEFSGDAAVRLALAAALFGRAGPTAAAVNPLPGSERFIAAAKRVAADHWALPAEAQARRAEEWRAQLGEHWISPFFAPWIGSNLPHIGGGRGGAAAAPALEQTNAAALLMADFIYRSHGPEGLAAVIRQLGLAETWDEVFLATLDRPTIALEAEVAAAVGADGGPAFETALRLRRLPDEVRLLPFATDAPGRPYVGIPLTGSTMPVQLVSGSVETTADGVPLTCLGPEDNLPACSSTPRPPRR